jgi:non-ribosomal peptide synthase protein (TIGR01720 family)
VNEYGPTETVVGCCVEEVLAGEVNAGPVAIGRPVANMRLYVLGRQRELLPVGVVGELYIGGPQVARGYWQRGRLTGERFVPDPFSERGGERLYRTGDLVKYLEDGRLEYVGRLDQQVKLRGYRIELGEIEAVLGRHEGVREAVALVRSGRLVAYVVAKDAEALTGAELRQYLSERVPEYLVPGQIVLLEQMPLTPNGKVDRNALPSPEQMRDPSKQEQIGPRTEAEEVLCAIWQEVLGVEQVGVEENFFELGGDSILSIQVVSRAARRGLRLKPRQLFQHQTIASLAAVAQPAAAVLTRAAGPVLEGEAPLTPIQRWFFERVRERRAHWNQALLLEVPGVQAEVLAAALRIVRRQHPALGLSFQQGPSGWRQSLRVGAESEVLLTEVDLSSLPSGQRSGELERVAEQAQQSLELERGRVLRALLFRGVEGEGLRLLVVIHHLVVDGVSWRVLLEDWQSAYEQLQSGRVAGAVELQGEATTFVEWARRLKEFGQSAEVRAEAGYWEAVAGSDWQLPLDHEGGGNQEGDAAQVTVQLTAAETEALLREVPGAYRTEVNDALLTALGRTLWRWTGERQAVVELEGHGREEFAADLDVSRTVGWFTTLYPVQLEVGGEIGEDLKGVKERLRRVPRRGLGYGLWRYGAQRDEAVGGQLVFNYLGQLDNAVRGESMFRPAQESAGASVWRGGERSHVLVVNASVMGGQLSVSWSYSRQLHRRETITQLGQWLVAELRDLIAHCRQQGVGGFTPSDFPAAPLSQAELDEFLTSVI